MRRIEFEMKVSLKDVRRLMIKRLITSRFIHIYYIFVIISSLLMFLGVFDSYNRSDYENLGLLVVIALIFPLLFGLGFARAAFKRSEKEGKKLFFLDLEGLGSKTDTSHVYFKWGRFDTIHETEEYIFVKKNGRSRFAIYKYLLPHETLSSIREILSQAPVLNKKMLPDDKLK